MNIEITEACKYEDNFRTLTEIFNRTTIDPESIFFYLLAFFAFFFLNQEV